MNEKIEGFYHVCNEKGLTGENGVLIPHQNVKNLMLKKEVIEAVKSKKFHVYPIETIDEALQILTGTKAGERKEDGSYEENTVNFLVNKKLNQFAEEFKKLARNSTKENTDDNNTAD